MINFKYQEMYNILYLIENGEPMNLGDIEFGDPWKHTDESPSVAIPILRKTIKKRNYKMFQEIKDELNLKDSGSIDKIEVSSKANEPIFIRGGSMFSGVGTQSRSANFGIVIMPNKEKIPVKVSCIHASHPIRNGATFTMSLGEVPLKTQRHMLYASSSETNAQSGVWHSINNWTATQAGTLKGLSDDLIRNMEKINKAKKDIEKVITKIPLHERQVGVAILDLQGVFALELFDSPKSWNAIAEETFKKYSEKLAETYERPLFKIDSEQLLPTIMKFLRELADGDRKLLFEDKSTKTYALSTKNVVGEYTKLYNEIIHLIAMRNIKEESLRTSSDTSTFTPTYGNYYTTAGTNDITTRVLSSIDIGMDNWSKLKGKVQASPNTLSNRIQKLENAGLIKLFFSADDRRKKSYEVTAKGKEFLDTAERRKALLKFF